MCEYVCVCVSIYVYTCKQGCVRVYLEHLNVLVSRLALKERILDLDRHGLAQLRAKSVRG